MKLLPNLFVVKSTFNICGFSFFTICIFTSFINIVNASSWFNFDDLALFDLIEEVNGTFYEFMSIPQNASSSDIKKSYRQLSLKFHPDKNSSPDAATKFRQLVSISDVLKDEEKRAKYDQILIHGLPDWRSGIYYLRKARKLGLLEMTVIVSLILTVGHYLCQLASYYEECYTYSQVNRKKEKKKDSRGSKSDQPSNGESIPIEKPHIIWNSLPVKSAKFSYYLTLILFEMFCTKVAQIREQRNKVEQVESEDETDTPRVKYVKQPKKLPEYSETVSELTPVVYSSTDGISNPANEVNDSVESTFKSTEWTQDELNLLVKASKRFPVGTNQRWERISEVIGRSVSDVTKVAKNLKSGELKISNSGLVTSNSTTVTCNDITQSGQKNVWSQKEQKLLEEALLKFPKGTEERWDKIYPCVPGKSKVSFNIYTS